MRCIPVQKNMRLVLTIVAVLLVCGAVTYAVPIAFEAGGGAVRMPWLFTLFTLVCVVGALFFLIRYRMTGFTYIIQPRSGADADPAMEAVYAGEAAGAADITRVRPEWLDLVVLKSQGSREPVMECVLSLGDLAAVFPLSRTGDGGRTTMKSVRDSYRARSASDFVFYDYTLTFRWEEATELVFVDGQRYVGIVLEADAPMTRYLLQLGTNSAKPPASE